MATPVIPVEDLIVVLSDGRVVAAQPVYVVPDADPVQDAAGRWVQPTAVYYTEGGGPGPSQSISLSNNTIAENSPPDTLIGAFTVGGEVDGWAFVITLNDPTIKLITNELYTTGVPLDYETIPEPEFRITATQTDPYVSITQEFTLNVTDVVEVDIPANTSPPVVSTPIYVGENMSLFVGEWTPEPVDYLVQWYKSDSGAGPFVPLTVVGSPQPEEVGQYIRVGVRAYIDEDYPSAEVLSAVVGPAEEASELVNIAAPYMSGDTEQGGTVIFNPGVWDNAVSYRYRVLAGDVDAPFDPIQVLLDWTTDTSTPITGIEDGEYLWLDAEATDAGSNTAVARSSAGHGPMEAAVPADAVILGTGGLNTATSASAQAYSFTMDIADATMRKFVLHLTTQGTSGAVNPTWNSVLVGGEPLTKVSSGHLDDDATRSVFVEVWELNGTAVPVGTGILVEATKSASTNTMRSTMAGVAIGNTSVEPLEAADVSFYSSTTTAASYSFASSVPDNKRLVLGFLSGNSVTTGGTPVVTPGTDWTLDITPWPGVRNGAAVGWSALMTREIAVAGSFNADYAVADTGSQRFGFVAVVRLAGDNS